MHPVLIVGFLLFASAGVLAGPDAEPPTIERECVILLHGLGRTGRSLDKMADALQAAGFRPVNLDLKFRSFPTPRAA